MPPFRLSAIAALCVCCSIAIAALVARGSLSRRTSRFEIMHAPPQATPIHRTAMQLHPMTQAHEARAPYQIVVPSSPTTLESAKP